MREVLDRYCNASGHRINNGKSSFFFGKGCPEVILDAASPKRNVE
jgi:hypothetical protein